MFDYKKELEKFQLMEEPELDAENSVNTTELEDIMDILRASVNNNMKRTNRK